MWTSIVDQRSWSLRSHSEGLELRQRHRRMRIVRQPTALGQSRMSGEGHRDSHHVSHQRTTLTQDRHRRPSLGRTHHLGCHSPLPCNKTGSGSHLNFSPVRMVRSIAHRYLPCLSSSRPQALAAPRDLHLASRVHSMTSMRQILKVEPVISSCLDRHHKIIGCHHVSGHMMLVHHNCHVTIAGPLSWSISWRYLWSSSTLERT